MPRTRLLTPMVLGVALLTGHASAQSTPAKQTPAEGEILDLPELVARVKASVVTILTYDAQGQLAGQGSGFFIAEDRIVTNRHVIQGVNRAELRLTSGATIDIAGVLADDKGHDLALLKVDLTANGTTVTIKPLRLADRIPKEGERIVVIGSPLGLAQTVSEGIVSAFREMPDRGTMIQITAAISPGSSGSPVFNMRGEVIAVALSILDDAQSLNFAVAIEHVAAMQAGKLRRLSELVFDVSPQSTPAQTIDPLEQGLDSTPLVASNFGLRMHLPAGSVVTSDLSNSQLSYLITEGGEAPTWTMRIQPLTPALAAPTAATLVQQYLKTVRAGSPKVRVIANDSVTVVGATGQRLYIERPAGVTGQAVTGWLVLATSQYDFLVFSLATTAQDFVRLRPVFDASFATIQIRQQDEVQAVRMARLARGRAIINSFTPQKLRSVIGRIGRKAVYRIYTPSASGRRLDDTEIGYLTIEGREGMRGELNAARARNAYTDMESEIGLLVLIEARGLGGDQPDHFLDVQSRYWMAWDRSKEAWSTHRTERLGNRVLGTTGETGVRDFGLLNVIISSKEKMSREPKQWSLPDRAYLCQPEVFFLGSLLPRDGSVGEELAFYYYDSHRQRMPLRVDRWQRTDDGSGHWTLISKLAIDAGSITQIFDTQGNRLKRLDANGVITERIDPQELQRLWKAKGLSR